MMTPEEIQQVVEDYRKSSQSLNENILSDKAQQFLRNLGRQDRDKVINNNKNNDKKNGNGAQGNGAQSSTSSSTTGAQGTQGGNNDNVSGAQGAQGAQSSTVTGAQGAQSSTVTGAQGAQGGQGTQNTIKKSDEADQYIRKGREVTINDFGGIKPTGAQGVQVKPKISPATFSTNQKQSRALVKSGELKDTDLNKYSRSNIYTADDGKTQVTRSTVNTIAQFDMGPNIKKGEKLGVISKNQRKKYDLQVANMNNKVEAYDLVLDYVLSEGHADTVEEAHYVMTQMDEETIKAIINEIDNLGGYGAIGGLIGAGAVLTNPIINAVKSGRKMIKSIRDKQNKSLEKLKP